MIGYMRPIKGEFNSEQRKTYQAIYCGLCRKLKYQHGFLGALTLNYEIVDMLLLIDSLRNDEPERIKMSCSISPLIWRDMMGINEYHYIMAAEMAMIIVNLEIQDNVEDENRMKDKVLLSVSNHKMQKVIKQSENVYAELKDDYLVYMRNENKALQNLCGFESVVETCGRISGTMGRLLSEVAGVEEINAIEKIMNIWGKWVYLVDATDDYFEDIKSNRFNPWVLNDAPSDWEKYVECLENEAILLINNLPIRRYKDVLEKLYMIQIPERRRYIFRKYYKSQEMK